MGHENGRRQGFFMTSNAAMDMLPIIKPTGFAVYSYLVKCADAQGRCWPSREAIAAAVDLKDRQLRAVLRTLEEAGMVVVGRRGETFQLLPPTDFRDPTTGNKLPPSATDCQNGSELPAIECRNGSRLPVQDVATGNISPVQPAVDCHYSIAKTHEQDSTAESARDDRDDPIRTAADLDTQSCNAVFFRYNGGTPGPQWRDTLRARVGDLLDSGATVTLAELFVAAERARAAYRREHGGGSPPFIDDLVTELAAMLPEAAPAPRKSTPPPPIRYGPSDEERAAGQRAYDRMRAQQLAAIAERDALQGAPA